MPIKSNRTLTNRDILIIWEMTEDYSFFEDKVTLSDDMWEQFDKISLPKRKTEWLVSKYMIQTHLGNVELSYCDRKLCLANSPYEVSVSHNDTYCCVMVSESVCGVDIEHIDRNFEKIATRVMSSNDLILANTKTLQCVVWSAKEALYKYISTGEIDFRDDFQIESISDRDIIIKYNEHRYTINYFEIEQCIVSYTSN